MSIASSILAPGEETESELSDMKEEHDQDNQVGRHGRRTTELPASHEGSGSVRIIV